MEQVDHVEHEKQLTLNQQITPFHAFAPHVDQQGEMEQTGGLGPFWARRASGDLIALFAQRQGWKRG